MIAKGWLDLFRAKRATAGAAALLLLLTQTGAAEGATLQDKVNQSQSAAVEVFEETAYASYLSALAQDGAADYTGQPIALSAREAEEADLLLTTFEEKGSVFAWEKDQSQISWKFTIESGGFYTVGVTFCALGGNGGDIKRALLVDGEFPYEELSSFRLTRLFQDSGQPRLNTAGDEVSPALEEVVTWQTQYIYDVEGLYLSAGEHTLSLRYLQEDIYLAGLSLEAPETPVPYEEKLEEWLAAGYAPVDVGVYLEAESEAIWKTQSTLAMISDSDPAMSPQKYGHTIMNALGGSFWNTGNDSITWKFEAPESGLYKLNLRLYQHYLDGLPVHRQIAIDGKVPFAEFSQYVVRDGNRWRSEVLADSEGDPYLVYLKKGTHTLTMTVKLGEESNGKLMKILEGAANTLSALILRIRMIIGNDPDTFYDYHLDEKIPTLLDTLNGLVKTMEDCTALALTLNNKRPMICNQFDQIASRLRAMIRDPYTIPSNMDDLTTALSDFGTWIAGLTNQPLALDYLEFLPPDKETVNYNAGFWQQVQSSCIGFIQSFFKDYTSVSGLQVDVPITDTLNVWIGRGSTYASQLKMLADDRFVAQTGIGVSVHMLPTGQLNSGSVNALMLAISSGAAPDVCLGVSAESPGEFAIRGALADLTQFSDYSETVSRFLPEMLVPFTYQKGVYALPETLTFQVLLYRTDIFAELGLSVPQTWDDVYENMLPVLNQNNLQFYVFCNTVNATYDMFLYQHGGSYYRDDYTVSALDTPEAYQAMKEYCELFTVRGMPESADLYNRMRTGEMPVGIGDYTVYLKLLTAAPELSGKWAIAQVPGRKTVDGTLDRSIGSCVFESCMIMAQSKLRLQAWEFLKWWTGTDTQVRYARNIEGVYGRSARWPSANLDAFQALDWKDEDLRVMQDSLASMTCQPVVLGSYYTTRHVNNAWNRVVVSKTQSVRDSMEDTVKAINKELKRRQEQYADE